MKAPLALAAIAAAFLYGCGSTGETAVRDEQLMRSLGAARTAFLQDQPELAASLYREALKRARERDDQPAIAAIARDLGAAELQKGDADAALSTAQATLAEMERRGARGTAPLRLVEAVALYRLERPQQAAAAAGAVSSDDEADPVVRARAIFLEGLIAAEAGDAATLEKALAQLPASAEQSELAADRAELSGWQAYLAGELRQARRTFLETADARRRVLDYRGMGRALAAAGHAAARDRDLAGAADLFLRAGRSAMIQGESAQARRWLGRAETLAGRARKPAVLAQARAWIREIAK